MPAKIPAINDNREELFFGFNKAQEFALSDNSLTIRLINIDNRFPEFIVFY